LNHFGQSQWRKRFTIPKNLRHTAINIIIQKLKHIPKSVPSTSAFINSFNNSFVIGCHLAFLKIVGSSKNATKVNCYACLLSFSYVQHDILFHVSHASYR
jgi:hypothetical protein